MAKIRSAIIPVAIILLGIFLRTYLLEKRVVFDFDQEIAALWVKNLLVDHKLSLIGQEISVGGVFVGPFYFYFLAPFFFLTNLNPIGGYLLTTLTSFLTMIVIYQLAKTLFNRSTALIAVFLYAIHPGIIGLDLTLAPSNMVMLLSATTALVLIKTRKTFVDFLLLGTILGLSFSIHPTATLLIPICLVYFFITKQKYETNKLVLILAPLIFFVAPLILFDLRHNGLAINNIFLTLFSKSDGLTQGFLPKIVPTAELILVDWAGILVSSDSPVAKLPLFLIAIWIFLRNNSPVLRIWVLLTFIALIFYPRHTPEYYLLLIFPVVLIYSVGFLNRGRGRKALLSLICLVSVWLAFSKNPLKENKTSLYFKNQAVAYIANQVKNQPIQVYYSNDPGLDRGFGYLFWQQKIKTTSEPSGKFLIIIPASREPETSGETFGAVKVARLPN